MDSMTAIWGDVILNVGEMVWLLLAVMTCCCIILALLLMRAENRITKLRKQLLLSPPVTKDSLQPASRRAPKLEPKLEPRLEPKLAPPSAPKIKQQALGRPAPVSRPAHKPQSASLSQFSPEPDDEAYDEDEAYESESYGLASQIAQGRDDYAGDIGEDEEFAPDYASPPTSSSLSSSPPSSPSSSSLRLKNPPTGGLLAKKPKTKRAPVLPKDIALDYQSRQKTDSE